MVNVDAYSDNYKDIIINDSTLENCTIGLYANSYDENRLYIVLNNCTLNGTFTGKPLQIGGKHTITFNNCTVNLDSVDPQYYLVFNNCTFVKPLEANSNITIQ